MPRFSADALRRYGCAILLVALSLAIRVAFYPVLGDRYPLFLFFVAIVVAAGYGGYGPSLVALVLSWVSVDYLFLGPGSKASPFESKSQIAFGYFVVGFTISLFGGFWRRARNRARSSGLELQHAFDVQKGERERLQTTLASIADAVITTDPEGRVIYLNPVASRLTGWSLDQAFCRPLAEVFRTAQQGSRIPEDLPIARVVGGEVVLSDDELMLTAKDKTARSIEHNAAPIRDSTGKITGVVIVFRDVTERHRAEQAKKESDDRFHQLADHINDVFWIHELDGSKIGYISPAYESLWGRSCESLYREPLSYLDAVHPEDRERAAQAYHRLKAGEATAEEYRVVRPDGTIRWVWDRGFPIRDESGRVVRLAGIAEDITDRKRTEQELREAARRKEEFLAVLSHELRNPLAPIQTALDLLDRRDPKGAGGEDELAMIRRQVQNLKRLVDDLLDVSRISRGRIELRKSAVDLASVAAQAVAASRPLFEEHRQNLHVSLPQEPIWLEADPTRLEQVLSNLLLNAAKFTPEGGQIWLEIEPCPSEVVIRVRDTGIGIEAGLLPKVFDLFLQGERRIGLSHEGGGIGLSLARNLVELHGGSIQADSPGPDLGSEFVVRLPRVTSADSQRPLSPQEAAPDAPGPLPARRILIVDDNVQAADSLGRLMSELFGQDVRIVYNGKKALETAESFRPDLILLDLQMAGMDGYQVALKLRQDPGSSQALIVAVTGWGHEEDRRRSREMGFDLHLVKPVTASNLRSVLIELEARLKQHRRPELIPLSAAHC